MNEIRFYRAVGKYGFLSNLYMRTVSFEGVIFRTSEDAYQYGKPKDKAVAEHLIMAPKPHLTAAYSHALFCFDVRSDWNKIKVDRMRRVLLAKFSQPDMWTLLDATVDATLIEDSKTDAFWGNGKKGNGKNMLGILLMEARSILRNKPAMEK